eukprot:1247277-Rhodomonas_salina.4
MDALSSGPADCRDGSGQHRPCDVMAADGAAHWHRERLRLWWMACGLGELSQSIWATRRQGGTVTWHREEPGGGWCAGWVGVQAGWSGGRAFGPADSEQHEN